MSVRCKRVMTSERTDRIIHSLRWPAVALLTALLAALVIWRACGAIEEGRKLAHEVGDVAERFKHGRITTTFIAAIPRLQPGGPLLELAAYEATETFSRSDERFVFFDLIPLGKTVTEIRVPVTYRYHLRLDDPWRLDVRGSLCLVRAPRIRPTQPPAIHTDRMEKRSARGWLRFNATEQMEQLERDLTAILIRNASDRSRVDFVRETCRRRVASFVRGWLLREDQWRSDRLTAVTVVFEDETGLDPLTRPPTLIREP
jgi:hypothetical protein